MISKFRATVLAPLVITMASIFSVGGGVLAITGTAASTEACTPKREAAFARIVKDRGDCAMENLDRTPKQMLVDCVPPNEWSDVQDLIDLFVGAQAGALKSGAHLPSAGIDAGADASGR